MLPAERTRLGWPIVVGLFWAGLFGHEAAAEEPSTHVKSKKDQWEN